MNWDLNEEQQAIKELTAQILDSERATWQELAKADLLGVCLPEKYGGSGHGIFELGLMLEEQGRAGVHLPLLPTLACAMAIAQFGTDKQKDDWLPRVVSGDVVLTAVLGDDPPYAPYAQQASAVFVGNTLYAKDALDVADLDTTSGEPQAEVRVGGAGPQARSRANRWLLDRWTSGLCMLQVGLCATALRLTADYTTGREQFGKPIATFQAVAQRAADAYIDTEAVRLTAYQAAWRLARGLPAANELAVAKFWAAEGGNRVMLAAQHLHGGVGVDMDYPLHTFTTWTKQIELTLGSATPSLLKLGRAIASETI
jgi:alkylation response protein AidB-like acyl-CoA dehydrogenase